MVKPPRQRTYADAEVDLTFKEVRRSFESLERLPAVRGQYLTNSFGGLDITLTDASVNKLQHKLGRKLTGWRLMDLRNATTTGRVARVTTTGADDNFDLWLDVQDWGSDIVVRIWVE